MKKRTTYEPENITLDLDTFEEQYTLKENHIEETDIWGGCAFETYGEAYDYVREQPENTIWTVVQEEDARYILSGLHTVNRLYYLMSEEPVPDTIEYTIPIL
jgi:hypothetical protein